jgi:hypothetical protein
MRHLTCTHEALAAEHLTITLTPRTHNRGSSDFPRFLSVATAALLRIHADDDINVRTVAEECLNQITLVMTASKPFSFRH